MKRSHLILLLKFVAITVPVTYWWMYWGKWIYGDFFAAAARPIYDLLGFRTLSPSGAQERFLNVLPFLVLMLLTPGLSLMRRSVGIVVGCFVLFLGHIAFSIATAWGPRTEGGGMTVEGFESSFPAYLFSDSLPFLLWVVICHKVLAEFATRAMAQLGPGERAG